MYKANKYSKMRLNYKGPFLKVRGQFTFFLSNTIFNFSLRFNKGFQAINMRFLVLEFTPVNKVLGT